MPCLWSIFILGSRINSYLHDRLIIVSCKHTGFEDGHLLEVMMMYLHGAIFGVAGYISVSMGTILFQSLRSRTRDSKDIVFKQFLASCKCNSIFFCNCFPNRKTARKSASNRKTACVFRLEPQTDGRCQNRKTVEKWGKNRKTALKKAQNRKTENK